MNPSSDLSWPRLPPGGERSRTSSVLAFSLRPGTNFTATNVTGPGRILGNAFSSGGRRIEATLNRLAGYNPFALQGAARRLADLLQDGYRRCHSECGEHDGPASVEFSADGSRVQYGAPLPQPEDLLYTVLEFGNRHCTRCYRPYWDLVNSEVRTGDMEALLTRINRSLTDMSASNIHFGAQLLTALALSNSIIRAAMTRIGTLPVAALALVVYKHDRQAHIDGDVVDALQALNQVLAPDFPEAWYLNRTDILGPTLEQDAQFLLSCASRSGILAEAADIRLTTIVRLILTQRTKIPSLSFLPFEIWERASAYGSFSTYDLARRLLTVLGHRHSTCPTIVSAQTVFPNIDEASVDAATLSSSNPDALIRAAMQEGCRLCLHCRKPYWDATLSGLGHAEELILHILIARTRDGSPDSQLFALQFVTALALSHPKLRELIIQVDMGASRIAAGAACDLDERPSGDIEIGHELVMSHLAAFQQLKHVLGPDFPHSWLSFEPWIKNTSNSASIETSMKELVGTLNSENGIILSAARTRLTAIIRFAMSLSPRDRKTRLSSLRACIDLGQLHPAIVYTSTGDCELGHALCLASVRDWKSTDSFSHPLLSLWIAFLESCIRSDAPSTNAEEIDVRQFIAQQMLHAVHRSTTFRLSRREQHLVEELLRETSLSHQHPLHRLDHESPINVELADVLCALLTQSARSRRAPKRSAKQSPWRCVYRWPRPEPAPSFAAIFDILIVP